MSALPVALTLKDASGETKHVSGMKPDGIDQICQGLKDQTAKDGRRWSSLIVKTKAGQNLRVLSPNSGILLNPSWFKTYWDKYINEGTPSDTPYNVIAAPSANDPSKSGRATPPNPSQSTHKLPMAT